MAAEVPGISAMDMADDDADDVVKVDAEVVAAERLANSSLVCGGS